MSVVAVDFFCGIGGATFGLQQTGIRVAKGIDIDERCRKTYEINCKSAKFVHGNLTEMTTRQITRGIGLTKRDKLLYSACPPCQPFSFQGKRDPKDDRAQLSDVFLEFVRERCPNFILMENVPGFGRAFGGKLADRFLKTLDLLGYKYANDILNFKDFGIPQSRRRYVLVASRDSDVALPEKTHGLGRLKYISVRETIEKYPRVGPGERHPSVPNHEAWRLSKLNFERIRNTSHDGGSRLSWPEHLRLKCHQADGVRHTDVYGRMSWDEPAPTLTTKCISPSNGRFGHPEQDRAITVREAAALQGFPDEFIFAENKTAAAFHIGNALPPPMAKILGGVFLRQAAALG